MTHSVTFPALKTSSASALIFLSQYDEYALYLTYGKTDAWANDAAPNAAVISVAQNYEIWNNMIGAKRLFGGDICPVVPRYDWTSGETYIAYDDKNQSLHNTKFYVVTEDWNVYKCIANSNLTHNLVSTVKPTTINPYNSQRTSDGYVWKYLYTVSDADQLRFTTNEYIPVRTLASDEGSIQWQVQQQADQGSIEVIKITNPGSGYSNASNVTLSISGDGSDFYGYVVCNSRNSITNIIITNTGRNYSYGDVNFSDANTTPGVGAAARAVISPPGGHGSDPLRELYSTSVIIDAKLKYDEEGVLPTTNDYRQIALLENPLLSNTNIDIKAMLESGDLPEGFPYSRYPAVLQAYTVICSGIGNYAEDELVYQGPSLGKATFVGRVISWNESTSKLLLINTRGSITIPDTLIGSESLTARVVSSTNPGLFKPFSGNILYVNNLSPIKRSSDQIEDFKILVKF